MLPHAESYMNADRYMHHEANLATKGKVFHDKGQGKIYEDKTKDGFATANRYNKVEAETFRNGYRSKGADRNFVGERANFVDPTIICYSCKLPGHKSFECPSKIRGPTRHTAAAIQVFDNQVNTTDEQSRSYG